MQLQNRVPVFADVEAAARRIAGTAQRTPLLNYPMLDARVGTRAFVKPECLQKTGSFKFRGALNKVRSALEAGAVPGVVAFSSGNHAQGVAAAAGLAKVPAIIVMPADAPKIKIANTKALGAEVRLYDRYREDREAIARSIAEERGFVLVPPYDDPAIIAGQGTIGLEIADDFAAMGEAPDVVVVPCSGGGLSSGIALAITTRFPEARVFACEPARFDDTGRSLAAGKRLSNPPDQKSICDALLSSTPGEITWPILKDRLTGALTATDEEALAAVSFAARRMKLVVEPGGAVALACALQGRTPKPARNIVIVCSGGNIDDEMLQKAMSIGD